MCACEFLVYSTGTVGSGNMLKLLVLLLTQIPYLARMIRPRLELTLAEVYALPGSQNVPRDTS